MHADLLDRRTPPDLSGRERRNQPLDTGPVRVLLGLGRRAECGGRHEHAGGARRQGVRNPMSGAALALAAVAFVAMISGSALAEQRVAVFDFEIRDTSGEGAKPELPDRLQRISQELRDHFAAAPSYELVDLTPAADRIMALGNRYGCNGCEAAIAREFGATAYVSGLIYKVSTLILSIQITVKDAETGAVIAIGVADIRGDNDRSWSHGVGWLMRNRILAD